jgi:hypothetical protein
MALHKTITVEGEAFITTNNGQLSLGAQTTTFPAYCKIIRLTGNKQQAAVLVEFSSDKYRINNTFDVPLTTKAGAENFIKQAYDHLKTLPEFAGATDC